MKTETLHDTEQEPFWAGQFEGDYVAGNEISREVLSDQMAFFCHALKKIRTAPESLIELGSNIGLNLRALKTLYTKAHRACVEINARAVVRLRADGIADEVTHDSLLNFKPVRQYDLALIKGVMTHLNTDYFPKAYQTLSVCSARHVFIAKIYDRRQETMIYRDHASRQFRRDFGGEFMDACPDFKLADYGFSYHRDAREIQDNLIWFLFDRIS